MTETYIATLDRIVDGQTAVLLLEDDDETVDQLDVDVTALAETSPSSTASHGADTRHAAPIHTTHTRRPATRPRDSSHVEPSNRRSTSSRASRMTRC